MSLLKDLYDFHKKEFELTANGFMDSFEALLRDSPCSILECAPAISPFGIHAARFRAGYAPENIGTGLKAIYRFLDRVSECPDVSLNRAIFEKIVETEFDLSKVGLLGLGVDYRDEIRESKVKCYFLIKDYPEKAGQVLSMHPPVQFLAAYPVQEVLVFGIEMYFDGRTRLELYLSLDAEDLRKVEAMEKLGFRAPVMELISICNSIQVSFEKGAGRVLHFHPQRPTALVRRINNRKLSIFYSRVQILNMLACTWEHGGPAEVTLSLVEEEIISENLENLCLCYALKKRS
jgi:LynF/TruF/PatF family peptide O-prenyltransferase